MIQTYKMIKMETKFIKTHSLKDVIVIFLIIVIGCVLSFAKIGTSANLTGYLIIPIGIAAIFLLKSEYKNQADNRRYKKKVYYFSNNKQASLIDAINNNPDNIDVKSVDSGNALRLDIYYSKDKAYIQLFKFVPYQYEPQTELVEHKLSR